MNIPVIFISSFIFQFTETYKCNDPQIHNEYGSYVAVRMTTSVPHNPRKIFLCSLSE